MRALALLGGLTLFGCAHMPECAAHGGSSWQELRSTHFVVRTDANPEVAKRAVVDLERAQTALTTSFPMVANAPRLEVVLFSNQRQLNLLVRGGHDLDGGLLRDWRSQVLVLSTEGHLMGDSVRMQVVLHELAHHLTGHRYARQPWWLSEGFAMYVENGQLDAQLNTAHFGGVPRDVEKTLGRWGPLPLEDLWSSPPGVGPRAAWHYSASAWFWVHFFMNTQGPSFQRFLEALEQGVEPRAAFATQFIHLTPEKLKEAGAAYARTGTFETRFVVTPPTVVDVQVSPLSNGDVHATLARVARVAGKYDEAVRQVELGVALNPHTADLLEQLAISTSSTAPGYERLMETMLAVQPDDARTWFFVGRGRRDAEAAYERAVTLDPGLGPALVELALLRSDEDLAARGLAAMPWSFRAAWVASVVAARRGECARAQTLYRRASEAQRREVTDAVPPEEPCVAR